MNKKYILTIVMILLFLISILPVMVNANYLKYSQSSMIIKYTEKSVYAESYDMIFIAPASYSSSLQPFIEHKNDCEILSKFVSIDDVYAGSYFEVQGRDNQEIIKYFIKDAIENWDISYVLFVGSFKQIPIRYCYNNDNYSASPEIKFISELYYADIYDENGNFSTWDSDGDELYGEWDGEVAQDKPIDLVPDVCLGRLACYNVDEVKTVVNKIINYEKQPADPSWFKRMVVVGGDTYENFEGYEGEINNQRAIDEMDGSFSPIKLWASNGKLKEKGWNIIREINKGCGFWYLSGHGNTNIWITYTYTPAKTGLGRLTSINFLFLNNKQKLPVCLVGGCHNSEFALPTSFYIKSWNPVRWLKECWSWQLVSKPNGGSIATIGATGLSWYGVEYGGGGTDWLNVNFFKEYSNGTVTLGQIWKKSLTSYLDNFPIDWETECGGVSSIDAKTVQEWTLLGDPSLTIGGGNGIIKNQSI
ncbi:hypothetical protein AYK20_05130 [Thermoplasmatales archaeon SG8-52-1]|nr:MAG: hypothetical protein AYK20_05130 [Thermoplasmatales archaeon SG8-52-1]